MLSFPQKIPLQSIESELTKKQGLSLSVLRLDILDFYVGGNKLFKLKYNLEEVKKLGHTKIVTFGGAWSNHLAAVAGVISQESKVQSQEREFIAVVRGEEPKEYSETLKFCKERGMQFHFVSREEYRKKNEPEFIQELKNKFGDFYLLPEGGSNELAVKGCKEILNYINTDFDFVCCPVGSGGTIAGLASGLKEGQIALGFVALKGGEYMQDVITKLLTPGPLSSAIAEGSPLKGEKLIHAPNLKYDYHFGGFAKTTPELLSFKKNFEKEFGFELDYIYTAKMFYGIFDLIQKNYFPAGTKIVAIHTGGLQGNKGFTES